MPDGSFEYVEAKGGKSGDKKRPGAKRTDNVKKSIANGALIKAIYKDIKYVVYFSANPEPKSYSAEMIDTALNFKFQYSMLEVLMVCTISNEMNTCKIFIFRYILYFNK